MDAPGAREQRLHIGPPQQVRGRESRFSGEPLVRYLGGHLGEQFLGDQRRELGGGRLDVGTERREDVVGGVVRLRRGGLGTWPVVVPDHGGPVVDQPEIAVPDQHVGVPPRAVHVVDQCVEPDDLPGLRRIHLVGQRIEAQRAGQVVHAEVQPAAGLEEFLDLLVRFGETDDGVELHGHQLRHAQPEPPAELAADDLRDQGLAPLPRPGELHDVRAEVVALDDPGERAAFTQGRDIAGRDDLSQHFSGPPISSAVRSMDCFTGAMTEAARGPLLDTRVPGPGSGPVHRFPAVLRRQRAGPHAPARREQSNRG